MPKPSGTFDFSRLSVAERILLVESLWDSIYRDSQEEKIELTDEQKRELDSRLEAEESGKITFSSWEDVERRLLAKK